MALLSRISSPRVPAVISAVTALALLLFTSPASAADPPDGGPEPASAQPQATSTAAPAAPAPNAATSPAPPPAPPPPPPAAFWGAPSSGGFFGALARDTDLVLKMYGDTGFSVRDNTSQPWPTATSNANVYAPGVWDAFFAPRLDIFGAADVNRLNFLTEVMFEAEANSISIDLERVQIAYLFANWLRVRAGRSHLAWGYYNDTYHHGNIFELTTSRPYGVNFEDSFGIIMAHIVGVGIDGTLDLGPGGAFRYDADVGNGRAADITSVAMQYAEVSSPTTNLRLRWLPPMDGLIVGVNAMHDVIPGLAASAPGIAARPQTDELVLGAHVVYTAHHLLVDAEGFAMHHTPTNAPSSDIYEGFCEVGYSFGPFTPYARVEYLRFPAAGDLVFQYTTNDAQGALVGFSSIYTGFQDVLDARIGVKWLVMQQLALKLEGDRLDRGNQYQDVATVKAAFGF
jgi:hypothetical protein